MRSETILFIGDSLVEYHDWQRRFPQHDIINLGVAGETVEGLLSRIGEIISNVSRPDLIFIMSGINNIAMDDDGFFVPYRKVLEQLSEAYSGTKIFIHSLLPTLNDWISTEPIDRANNFLKHVAMETGVEFLDLHSFFLDESGKVIEEFLLSDGVHLSEKGYDRWSRVLEKIITEEYS
jgi:lysophospholipase L1-like esterase